MPDGGKYTLDIFEARPPFLKQQYCINSSFALQVGVKHTHSLLSAGRFNALDKRCGIILDEIDPAQRARLEAATDDYAHPALHA